MTRISATLLATVLVVVSLPAEATKEARIVEAFHCTDVENDVARLECYDKAYADFRAASQATGEWFSQSDVDPFDDSVITMIGLNAEEPGEPLFGPVQLVIRCRGDDLSAWISWNKWLGKEPPLVRSRIGRNTPETRRWPLSSSRKSTFYPGDEREFVRELMDADKLVAQLTPDKSEAKIATFDIKGLKAAVKPIRKACLITPETDAAVDTRTRGERLLERVVEQMTQ